MVMANVFGIQSVANPPGVSALADRQSRMAAWAHDANGLLKAGVVPGWGGELQVALGTGLQVTVATGAAVVPAPQSGHGGWPVINEAVKTITLQPRNASNARIDRIIARVADPFYYNGGDKLADIKPLTGTPGAVPAVPTVPESEGSYLDLGQVLVPSSANGGPLVLSKHTAMDVPRTGPAEMLTPYVIATNSGADGQAFPANTYTNVAFAGAVQRSVGAFSTAQPTRLVATKSGLYLSHLSLAFAFLNLSGDRNIFIDAAPALNGLGGVRNYSAVTIDRNPFHGVQFSTVLKLNAGDYLEWAVSPSASVTTRENFGQTAELVYLGSA